MKIPTHGRHTAGLMASVLALLWATGCAPSEDAMWRGSLHEQASTANALMHAISVAGDSVVWAGGREGTVLRSTDGGRTWGAMNTLAGDSLDFTDIAATGPDTAWLLAGGAGSDARIYRTTNGGGNWTLQWMNREPDGFYNCIDFWDSRRGLASGDPIGGEHRILLTTDGGERWHLVAGDMLPKALAGEAGYATGGQCVATGDGGMAWVVFGNASATRLLSTPDYGTTWSASELPLAAGRGAGATAATIISDSQGFVFGGPIHNGEGGVTSAVVTIDGGSTWRALPAPPFEGAIYGGLAVPGTPNGVVVVGPGGMAASVDGGRTWHLVDDRPWWAVGPGSAGTVWAAGPEGRISSLSWPDRTTVGDVP